MKKVWVLFAAALVLVGCGEQPTLETVADENIQAVSAVMQQVLLELPDTLSTPVMENSEQGALYLGDNYTLTLHTTQAGDLEDTLRQATGFSRKDLQLMQTGNRDIQRYECVWTAAGENENQVGRLCVLDDGAYHYVLTAMTGESQAGQLRQTWNTLFDSFRLVSTEIDVNTGS